LPGAFAAIGDGDVERFNRYGKTHGKMTPGETAEVLKNYE